MSEEAQKAEYIDLLQEARKLEDTLAAVGSKLKDTGRKLVEVFRTFEKPETINFTRQEFEDFTAPVGDLVEQYREAHARRTELESRLIKFSWHR